MSDDKKSGKGDKRYLVGLDDFNVEMKAGKKKVKKWVEQGAPISNDGTYRAKTDDLLQWLCERDQEEKKGAA